MNELKLYSELLNNMISFYQEYSDIDPIWQPSVAKLETGMKSITQPPVSELENENFKQKMILSTK